MRASPTSSRRFKGLSQDVVDGFDEAIELLFVDGSHAEDDVRDDFEQWVPKVVEGGVVAFQRQTWHVGVRRVVAEKIYGSRGFRDVRFVPGSTTVARKVAQNTARDRLPRGACRRRRPCSAL